MPENDIMRILRIYQVLEVLGVMRETDGARYVAFMVSRLKNDPSEELKDLYNSAEKRFSATHEEVEEAILQAAVEVYNTLTSPTARFYPELGEIMDKSFENNPFNIKIPEKFLKGILRAIKE